MRLRTCILSVVVCALPTIAVGQTVTVADTLGALSADEANPVPTSGATLLDAPIEANRYVLGPGDRLDVSIFGAINQIVPVEVSPGGELVIPGVGVVAVGGQTLAEAEASVRAAVLRLYQNVGVHLTLASVRQFKVYVTGDIPAPGVRVASAVTRVSEVVPVTLQPPENVYLHRNILVRRSPRDSISVDLTRFRLAGSLDSNPRLRDGDIVVVPVVNERVYVFGRVSYPGAFEFRSGETLAELLVIANGGGGFAPDAADTVRVSRRRGSQQQDEFSFTRAEALGREGQAFVLEASDAIYVPRKNIRELPDIATVSGEVVRPGTYPIDPGVTTVRDLISLAGGFQPDASLVDAELRRLGTPRDTTRLASLRSVPTSLLSSRERRLLIANDQNGARNVIIDFQQLFLEGKDAYDQVVESGDVLTIPERHDDIAIQGAVVRPGLVQYVPNADLSYFIALAGGYTGKADRGDVTIIHANSAARFDAEEVPVLLPGDLVIVPYKEKRNYLQYLQTTSSVVTTITGLVLTFVALVR